MVRKMQERTRKVASQFTAPGFSVREMSGRQWRELAMILVPALLLVAGAFFVASKFVEPAPPKMITMSAAGQAGSYFANGQRYAAILKRSGITLDVKTSAGSVENVSRLRDPNSGISVALLQGGTTNSELSPGLISLGRVFLEPMWVFYRGEETIDRLPQLKGRKITIGPEGSGTRFLALNLLKPNTIDQNNTTLLSLTNADAITAIMTGSVDAVLMTSAANSAQVQTLLRAPGVKLMSFSQAEAYTRLFPYLSRIVLPKGAIDLVANIPAADVEMVAPVAALVAREDLHPALVGLLAEAAKEVHGKGSMFNRIGEFPKIDDPEFEMSADAERILKSGPPALQRYLPFWLATFIDRMKVMILPLATILLPLFKVVPAIYRWRVRRRIQYWYSQVRDLEYQVGADTDRQRLADNRVEMARIDEAVSVLPIPPAYQDQYYTLRSAINLVRVKLA